jgi:hypothetical protein
LNFNQEKKFLLHIVAHDPPQQEFVAKTFERLHEEFPSVDFKVAVKSRKVVPWEVVLEIAIDFAKGIAVTLVIKVLEKLWKEIKRNDIVVKLDEVDIVQKKAERYLTEIGITDFEVIKREDRGLYVLLIFRDNKGDHHRLRVTSFDSHVIDYRRGKK